MRGTPTLILIDHEGRLRLHAFGRPEDLSVGAAIATLIAEVVCGGDVDAGSLVSEEYLMAMERDRFCALLDHPKTQERIMGMLSTGKPVRN